MSLIRQCDRCNKTFQPYIQLGGNKSPVHYTKVHVMNSHYLSKDGGYDGGTSKFWDLCPECKKQLTVFLEHPDINVPCDTTMCSKCAKDNCHCDCTREFESIEQQPNETNDEDDDWL